MGEAGQDMYIDTIGMYHVILCVMGCTDVLIDDTYVATDVQSVGELCCVVYI